MRGAVRQCRGLRHDAGEAIGQRGPMLLCTKAIIRPKEPRTSRHSKDEPASLADSRALGRLETIEYQHDASLPTRARHVHVVAAAFAGLVSDLSCLGLSTATADALALHAQQGGMPLDGARARASQALFSQSVSQPLPRS